jgi:hypothetical protein
MSDAIFDDFSARDVAKAAAASNRIILDLLVELGVQRQRITDTYSAKVNELIAVQHDDKVANLLRLMAGTVPPLRTV